MKKPVYLVVEYGIRHKDTMYAIFKNKDEFDWVCGKTEILPDSLVLNAFNNEQKTEERFKVWKSTNISDLKQELSRLPFHDGESSRTVGYTELFFSIKEITDYLQDNNFFIEEETDLAGV